MSVRPAATVVILDPEMHVLLVQRSKDIKFFGGAYAFPGGRVEPQDVPSEGSRECWAGHEQAPAGLDFCDDRPRLFAAYERAARREVEEESGLRVDGPLLVWARWITPLPEPKRYDTLFFVARVARAEVTVDGSETIAHRWLKPAQALALAKTGEIVLPPPTFVTLTELDALGSWDAIVHVSAQGVPEVFPQIVPSGEQMALVLPPIARGWPANMPTRAEIVLTPEGARAKFGA